MNYERVRFILLSQFKAWKFPQRDIATIEAANLVLTQLGRVLNDRASKLKAILEDILPVYGIRWDARVAQRSNSHRLCRILRILRSTKLDT